MNASLFTFMNTPAPALFAALDAEDPQERVNLAVRGA